MLKPKHPWDPIEEVCTYINTSKAWEGNKAELTQWVFS